MSKNASRLGAIALALVSLGSWCLTPARADLRLTLEVHSSSEAPVTAAATPQLLPPPFTIAETITVGPDYLSDEEPDVSVTQDFKLRQIRTHVKADSSWSLHSLYSDIGFREAEMSSRMIQAQAAAKRNRAAASLEEIENLFALSAPQSTRLTLTDDGDQRKFTAGQHLLFVEDLEGTKLNTEEVAEVQRMFLYRFPVHPNVLEALELSRTLPRHFELWHNNGRTDHLEVKVLRVDRIGHDSFVFPTAHLTRGDSDDPALNDLVKAASALTPQALRFQWKAAQAQADKDLLAGRTFEGFLESVAVQLGSGQPFSSTFIAVQPAFDTNAQVQRFSAAVKPAQSRAEAQEKLQALQALAAAFPEQAQTLAIFEASFLPPLGRQQEAKSGYQQVLKADPGLVGVWKNLGDLYYRLYEMPNAWLCWDAARKLAPEHPMMKGVNDLELHLRTAHPEFF